MLALTRRSAICFSPRLASLRPSSVGSFCMRRVHVFRDGLKSRNESVGRASAALAIAVSCITAGGFFVSQSAFSLGSQPPTVVASVPPSCQSFATSGIVPSGGSPLTLSYSAACEASNDPVEDRFVVAFSPMSKARFLCVFDGHGGSSVAEYVARTLPSTVDAELMQLSLDAASSAVESAISRAFVSLDLQLSQDMMKPEGEALRRPGSCALLAVERNGWLHVAHAGDCRAVVTYGKGEQILLATKDHNAKEAAEQIQLRTAHPGEDDVVICKHPSACYVKGRLQPTRAFGDFHLKSGKEWRGNEWIPTRVRPGPFTPPYITARPSTSSLQLLNTPAPMIILATDGIWDEITSEVAACVAADAAAKGNVQPASAVMNAAFDRAAASSRMTAAQLKNVPPGSQRRRLVDDCTVVVGVFGGKSKL